MPGCGCGCLPFLFQQKEPPLGGGGRKRGRPPEGIGRRGARGGRAPARLKLTRTPTLFVHSALSARSLAPRLLTLHCSLKSEAPQPAAAARAEHAVCGSTSAGDPEPPPEPAPGPARRASPGTHPQRRLSPLATPRSAGKRGRKIPPFAHHSFLLSPRICLRRRCRKKDIFLNPLSGRGLPLPCGATSATLPSTRTPDRRGHVRETGS